MPLSRLAFTWLPVVAWAALIFALSSIPDLGTGLGGWDLAFRKAAHLAEYAVLGALLARALYHTIAGWAWLSWVAGTAYAASDELHQHFVPGRQASALDLAIDAVGVAVGVLAVKFALASRAAQAQPKRAPDDGAAESSSYVKAGSASGSGVDGSRRGSIARKAR